MGSVNLYGIWYDAVVEFFWIPWNCHCIYHVIYYNYYLWNNQHYPKPITKLSITTFIYYPIPVAYYLILFDGYKAGCSTIGHDLTLQNV